MMVAFSVSMASEEQDPNKMRSYTSVTEISASQQGKRKSGSLFQNLKFWKKDKKRNTRSLPMIGKPMQFQHVSGTSSRQAGTTTEERSQKTVSLPHHLTRRSALTSHAPSVENLPLEKPAESKTEFVLPPPRILHRRVTLPKLGDTAVDEHSPVAKRQSILDDGQIMDPADIGFAVTSGSNFLKRRSRSANALRITSSEPQSRFSPVSWTQERRRSDDMFYWREGASPEPANNTTQDIERHDQAQTEAADPAQSITTSIPELPAIEQAMPISEDAREVALEKEQDIDDTFHFGNFSIKAEEGGNAISMEERVIAMEIRLMDMEYAVSKLQSSSTASDMLRGRTKPTQDTLGRESSAPSHRSQLNSDAATERTVSTQPTTLSLFSTSEEASTQSKLHIDTDDSNQLPVPGSTPAELYRRNSLNALTIDHLNSLLGLIRREQAARHRLEDQIVELQREFKLLRQQLLPQSIGGTPYATLVGWNRTPQPNRLLDDNDTDDGVHEIYTTPTEFTRRAVYEGGVFAGQREGVAF